jgi:hypothetical protein
MRTSVVIAAAVALALGGCSSSSKAGPAPTASRTPAPSSAPSTAPSTAPPTAPSPSDSAAAGTPAALVTQVVLATGDLGSGLTVQLIDGGDALTDPTLDTCGYKYTTEAHRVARRQVEVLTSTGDDTGVSNEVVAYDSAAEAAKALVEYRASVTHCPKNVYVKLPASEGAPQLRYTSIKLVTLAGLPVPENAVARVSAVVKGSPPTNGYSFIIIQVHGTVLDAVYVNDTSPLPQDALDVGTRLAVITGTRLAALSDGTTV